MAEHSNITVTVKSNSSLQTDTESLPNISLSEEQNAKVLPVQICESTIKEVPSNLQTIIEKLQDNNGSDTSKSDLLVCLLYVIMIETGFIPTSFLDDFENNDNINFNKQRILAINKLPTKWKINQPIFYKFEFILQPFPTRICKMICLNTSINMTVNLVINSGDKFAMQINTNRFVTSEHCKIIPMKFRNLNELSILFKNQIALPAKNCVLDAENYPNLSLQNLPIEILYKIATHLRPVDYFKFIRVCKRIKNNITFYEHQIWKHFFFRDFPRAAESAVADSNDTWLILYKTEIERQTRTIIFARHSWPFNLYSDWM